jgi:hypothetical protein
LPRQTVSAKKALVFPAPVAVSLRIMRNNIPPFENTRKIQIKSQHNISFQAMTFEIRADHFKLMTRKTPALRSREYVPGIMPAAKFFSLNYPN